VVVVGILDDENGAYDGEEGMDVPVVVVGILDEKFTEGDAVDRISLDGGTESGEEQGSSGFEGFVVPTTTGIFVMTGTAEGE
jgi:hypothetical protein